ncbi:cytochrome P450 734A1 isoform X1 [Amborella trichopoda]|nr:cytochrome P450 734A1 isoform X1 [Amborella trichopoda]|eukprot:XP_011627757.2 cytochrome P450 734A1 isoform X1 [Amborella trichopoda]
MVFVILALLLSLFSFTIIIKCIYVYLWCPFKLESEFRRQGISGPGYRPPFGNAPQIVKFYKDAESHPISFSHHILPMVAPQYHHWSPVYGKTFLYWFGSKPRLAIGEPELVREVLLKTGGPFEKLDFSPLSRHLVGQGLVGLKGQKWSLHRKMINPAFHMDQVKAMVPTIVASTTNMLKEWEQVVGGNECEIEIYKELHRLTADVISRTAFGSSYEEGKNIFKMQEEQMLLVSEGLRSVYIPGFRFVPTKKNRRRWKVESDIRSALRQLISNKGGKRENCGTLLGLMLSANHDQGSEDQRMGLEDIVDECKTFYFAGKDTTANLLTWAVILLSVHTEWQTKARDEVLNVCGESPVGESLNNLKIVGMILNETLRLYPPAALVLRQTAEDLKLGQFHLPKSTQLYLPIAALHHDPELWGDDTDTFNPDRFSEGPSAARKHPAAFIPFGFGPRTCIGQSLAIVEAKVVLAMLLGRFAFEVSPSYVHAPMLLLTVQPRYGAQVVLRRLRG